MMARLASAMAVILILVACGSGLNQTPAVDAIEPMRVLYRGIHCPESQPGVRVIRDAAAWAEWHGLRQKMSFSAEKEMGSAASDLDFGQASVIVISMGQKPTSGFAVDVSEGSVTRSGTSLTVSTVWQQPPEDAILPQVITSPCVAISVSTQQYRTIKVENQNGDIVIDEPI